MKGDFKMSEENMNGYYQSQDNNQFNNPKNNKNNKKKYSKN